MQGMLSRAVLAAALFCSSVAVADTASSTASWRPVVNGAFTEGGDDLVKVQFRNADSEKIKAGGLLMLGGGMVYTPAGGAVSLRLTINYHFDTITAKNGDASFERFPLEALLFFNAAPHRLGVGLSHHLSPEAEFDFDDQSRETVKFDDATGVVVEYGYQVTPQIWLGLRYTTISYDAQDLAREEVDGDHVGLTASFTF